MKTIFTLAVVTAALLTTSGCLPSSKSGRGFHMPSGDAERGRVAFVDLKCNRCHRVAGVELPAPPGEPEMIVTLGGEVSRMRTYGDLVTSIIHPNQGLAPVLPAALPRPVKESPMKPLHAEMSVQQLLDLVTFLEPTYRVTVPEYRDFH